MKTLLITLSFGLVLSILEANLFAQTAASTNAGTPVAPSRAPNIIFILADDLGYGDLSVSGNPYIKTPNLDELAKHSIVCTKGYAAYPICLPSRVSILSGKYSDRTGARMCIMPSPAKLDQPWLPARLKAAGYTTCAIGKWGLGDRFPTTLRPMGFDTWAITHPGGGEDRWNYLIRRPGAIREPSAGRYVTDVMTNEAIKFIDQNTDHPFFIYLAEPAPHWPLEAPEDEIAPFRNQPGINSGAAVVYAMVQHLDKKIGDLITHLREKGLYDNTIIVFTSDNGPDFGTWMGLNETRWNDSLAGHKGYVWEGGIKVPTFISWPAVFGDTPKPFDGLVDGIDWQPTLCAAAGITIPEPPIDGINLMPRFLGQSTDPIPVRFWNFNIVRSVVFSNGAMRDGDWKLVRPPIPEFNVWGKPPPRPGETPVPSSLPEKIHPGKNPFIMQSADLPEPEHPPDYQLFNLATDPGEKHDLSAQEPQRLSQMRDAYEQWFKEVTSGPDNADVNATNTPPSRETIIPQ